MERPCTRTHQAISTIVVLGACLLSCFRRSSRRHKRIGFDGGLPCLHPEPGFGMQEVRLETLGCRSTADGPLVVGCQFLSWRHMAYVKRVPVVQGP